MYPHSTLSKFQVRRPSSRHSSRLLALAAGALLVSTASAQTFDPAELRPAPEAGAVEAHAAHLPTEPSADVLAAAATALGDQLLFDEPGDGALWVRGATYKARFGPDGATIVPYFGAEAPRNFPLELRANSASVGGVELDATAPAAAAREGSTVRIDRGAFVELYELTTRSLEQRFVFADRSALPEAGGDLVVRMNVESELAASDLGATLRFENDAGRIDYGQAFALDAAGQRIELDSVLVDGAIELRVPASFVERAQFPLVIDPLITMYTAANTSQHDLQSDVSYDVSTDRWGIVFTSIWSQADHDVFVRLATGAYQVLPGYVTIDFTTDLWTTPKIANNNYSDQFLVCAAAVPASGVAEIRGRFVQPAVATTGSQFNITPVDGAYRNWPDIGGDPYFGLSSNFCVVWQRYNTATDLDIEARVVSHNGAMGGIFKIENTNEWHGFPTISSSMGLETSGNPAVWTVVWQHQYAAFDHDIYAAQLSWGGTIVTPMFPVADSNLNETNPVVSTILDPVISGAPRTYAVAFERDFGDHDVIATVLQGSTVLGETNLIGDYPSSRWYDSQRAPAIDSDGERFLVAFDEIDMPLQQQFEVYARSYYWDGSELVACEAPQPIGGSPAPEADPSIHSMASSGGPRERYLAAFSYGSANNGFDIVGVLYQGCTNDVETVCQSDTGGLNCPCSNNGDYGHGCGNSAHAAGGLLAFGGAASVSQDTASLTASHLPANVACLFFQGTQATAPFAFGNGLRCVNGISTRIGLKACDASGLASYPQTGDVRISDAGLPVMAGMTRYYQAWYRDPSAVSCGSTFNLTNALRVTWAP
jgi:hypothetical protein